MLAKFNEIGGGSYQGWSSKNAGARPSYFFKFGCSSYQAGNLRNVGGSHNKMTSMVAATEADAKKRGGAS